MKKLEIIIGSYELNKVIDILDESEALGYTVIADAAGRGKSGKRVNDEITEVHRRNVIICIDDYEKIKIVLEKLKKLKERYSLKAFVSDVSVEL